MDKTVKAKLLECRSYAEAKPILETLGLSVSGDEIARTAYQIRETQPNVAEHFLRTVIREADDVEVKDVKKPDTDKHEHVKETDDNTDTQSSSVTGLEKIGSESSAPEGAPAQPEKKDQMGVSINEMGHPPNNMGQHEMGYPPSGMNQPSAPMAPMAENGLPPQGGAPPQAPPQAPMPPQAQQMMHYTISETMKLVNPQLKKIAEAIISIDKKVQETQMSGVKSLALGDKFANRPQPQVIRETTGVQAIDLNTARQNILRMNTALNEDYIQ